MSGNVRHTILCDYLEELKVPHTVSYSEKRFASMPFPTLFGLTKLLEEYGVRSEGYCLSDKKEIEALTVPFIAMTDGGMVIVVSVSPDSVGYITQGVRETMPRDEFDKVWKGSVLLSYPNDDAREPDYSLHARIEFFMRAKKWVLLVCVALVFAWFFITGGLYRHLSTVCITLIDIFGLYISFLLVSKSANRGSAAADRVCGVIQEGGCDKVLATSASKFFGLFGWSEVGLAYFSVSLIALLLLPQALPWLALCNLCCVPFPFWSVWYQRFRARHWCTLCLLVQASLLLLFVCYLAGGWLRMAFPVRIPFVVLGLSYVGVMLGINALMPLIENEKDEKS